MLSVGWIFIFLTQPIEILKPFFILMTVKIITSEKLQTPQIKYFLSFLLLSSVIILLVDQPDLGQSILLIVSWIAVVFISGVSLIYILIFDIFIIYKYFVIFLPDKFGYVINRLITF